MGSLVIDGKRIDDDSECWVIAEIGHNHQGSVDKCKELFKSAKECGADAVKLQKRHNKSLFTRAMYDSAYNSENSFGPTYGAHREALEFGAEEYAVLKAYAKELDITFFATAFDFESADFLAKLDVPVFKMASGDLTNTPLLKYVAKIGKPMIISTGGGTMEDVKRAYDAIIPINKQLAILQCTASYPVEAEQMNLRVISTFRSAFPEAVIGLSDHQNGIAMSPVAYTLGARIIEKHFTLNRAWKGTDHAFSLEPVGLKKMVRDLRRTTAALGDGAKRRFPNEAAPLYKMAKKLVYARPIAAGKTITRDDIAIKSPSDGLPPYELDRVVGKVTRQAVKEDDSVKFEDLKDA
ncbi:MAG TPA: N-acetylneuraminate synthase family protein [Polyangia bacterium]